MARNPNISKTTEAEEMSKRVSDTLEKIIDFSKEFHEQQPTASPRQCIEIGAGRALRGPTDGEARVVQLAITEMAARWLFNSDSSQPAE